MMATPLRTAFARRLVVTVASTRVQVSHMSVNAHGDARQAATAALRHSSRVRRCIGLSGSPCSAAAHGYASERPCRSAWQQRHPIRRHSNTSGASASSDAGADAKSSDAKQPRKLRVYTRTGDKGKSALYNGARAPKSSPVFAALGDTDELNAAIGIAIEHCTRVQPFMMSMRQRVTNPDGTDSSAIEPLDVLSQLVAVQSRLLDLGSCIATPLEGSTEEQLARAAFSEDHATVLESWIDAMSDALPPLRNFILPSGGLASAHLHLARTVCRRAERAVMPLVLEGQAPAAAGVFLNRLSDYLFTAARFAALSDGMPEQPYKKAPA